MKGAPGTRSRTQRLGQVGLERTFTRSGFHPFRAGYPLLFDSVRLPSIVLAPSERWFINPFIPT